MKDVYNYLRNFRTARKVSENYSNLINTNFKNVTAINTKFINVSLINANFQDAILKSVKFNNSILAFANFSNVKSLEDTDFTGTVLFGANFENTNFDGAIVTGVDFYGVIISEKQRKYLKEHDAINVGTLAEDHEEGELA
jgi:uncharacterized protein YjbI with pentapeptide repeats